MSWFPSYLVNSSHFKLLAFAIPLRGLSSHYYDGFQFSNTIGKQQTLELEITPISKCAIHLIKDKALFNVFSSRHYLLSIIFTVFRNEVFDSQNSKLFPLFSFEIIIILEKLKSNLFYETWMLHFISKEKEVYQPFNWATMIFYKSFQSLFTSLNPVLDFVC